MNYQTIQRITKHILPSQAFSEKDRKQHVRWFIPYLLVLLTVVIGAALLVPNETWQPEINNTLLVADIIVAFTILAALAIAHRGYVKTGALAVLLMLFGIATYITVVTFQTLRNPDVMIYLILIPLAGLLLGKRPMLWFALLTLCTVLGIAYLEWNGYIVSLSGQSAGISDLVILLLAITINTIFLNAAIGRAEHKAAETRRSTAELSVANQELAYSKAELQQSRDQLEIRVIERTEELRLANTQLQAEIEQRQQLLDALHKSEANWRSLVTSVPELIATVQLDGVISFINRGVGDYTAEMLIGRPATELCTGTPYRARFVQSMQQVLATGKMVTYESERVIGEKTFWYLNRLGAIQQDGRVEALILIATDITEQKQTEAAMHRMQKMESLGVLAGGVAHDFNNLLTVMSAQQSLALLKLAANDPARRHLQQTMKAVERATELTHQMLNYAGRGKSEQKMIDLNDLVADNIHLFSASIPKNVRLSTTLADALPLLYGDQGQIQQLIMNLLLNSADAIGEAVGEIKIITRSYELQASEQNEWAWPGKLLKSGSYVLLEVQDTGCGMDAATLAKIFDPFFTTKFTGRGLGLASVIGIINAHHGGLHVESTPGRGTTFFILLPIANAITAEEHPAVSPVAHTLHGELVLLIDDEEDICEATAEILTTAGLTVITAHDGPTGLAKFYQARAAIKLVILDLSMPKMNGEAVLQAIRKLDPVMPVLLTSGYDEYEVMDRVQEYNVGFIAKPYKVDMLLQTVHQQLAQTPVQANALVIA